MLKGHQAILVALVVTAFWSVILVLTSDASIPYEICEPTKEGAQQAAKQCARYHVISFAFREIGAHLDIFSALITAVATAFIARYTFTLKKSTDRLWEASEKQFGLARAEFLSTHRPKVRIKHIWFASQDGQSSIEKLESGKPVVVRIDIVNIGGTTAFLSLFNFMIRVLTPSQRLPQRPPYNEPNTPKIGVWPFRVNSGITFTQHLSDGTILSSQDIQDIRSGIKHLFVFGTVEYWDDESRPSRFRQTGFCRRLDFELPLPARPEDNGRFRKVKDPDYEYQD